MSWESHGSSMCERQLQKSTKHADVCVYMVTYLPLEETVYRKSLL